VELLFKELKRHYRSTRCRVASAISSKRFFTRRS
jgi:hypothetical protein